MTKKKNFSEPNFAYFSLKPPVVSWHLPRDTPEMDRQTAQWWITPPRKRAIMVYHLTYDQDRQIEVMNFNWPWMAWGRISRMPMDSVGFALAGSYNPYEPITKRTVLRAFPFPNMHYGWPGYVCFGTNYWFLGSPEELFFNSVFQREPTPLLPSLWETWTKVGTARTISDRVIGPLIPPPT